VLNCVDENLCILKYFIPFEILLSKGDFSLHFVFIISHLVNCCCISSVNGVVATELEGLRAGCQSSWRMKLLVLLWNYFHPLKVKVPGMVVSQALSSHQ